MQSSTISIHKAIRRGLWSVNAPILPIMFTPLLLPLLVGNTQDLPTLIFPLAFVGGLVCAWIWWSTMLPRWRLWALQHVDDGYALHLQAISAGLEWPHGHIFERTEIKSRQHKRQERGLLLHSVLAQLAKQYNPMFFVTSAPQQIAEMKQALETALRLSEDGSIFLQPHQEFQQSIQQLRQEIITSQANLPSEVWEASFTIVLKMIDRFESI